MSYFKQEYSYSPILISFPTKKNQDRGNVWKIYDDSNEGTLMIVADGHGKNGHVFSECIADYFDKLIISNTIKWFSQDELFITIEGIFKGIKTDLINKFGYIDGGSTLSVAIVRNNKDIWIANVGDSDIKLFNNDEKIFQTLTEDHSPVNIFEAQRILKTHPEANFQYDANDKLSPVIPIYKIENNKLIKNIPDSNNFYYKNKSNELASYIFFDEKRKISMTRSFGDYYFKQKVGLIDKPFIKKYDYLKKNETLICATDGFWDCWTNNELLNFLSNNDINKLKDKHLLQSDYTFGSDKDDCIAIIIKN